MFEAIFGIQKSASSAAAQSAKDLCVKKSRLSAQSARGSSSHLLADFFTL
jgi:hypothetical protein